MRALLCILLLAGIAFSAAGSVSTESLPLDFTNPYVQTDAPTEQLDLDFFNPYIQTDTATESLALEFFNPYVQTDNPTEELSVNWTSVGVDFPVFLGLSLSPDPVNYVSHSLSISANLTSAYSQEISDVTANITGCGDGFVVMSKQSGTCSSSCIYTGSFSPTQSGICDVAVKAADLLGSSGYAEASVVSSSSQYIFTSMTGPDGIAGIDITALPGPSGTMFIRASGSAEIVQIGTSASSLYMNVLVKLGANPAPNKEVSVEIV
jgi:hypothetical protein